MITPIPKVGVVEICPPVFEVIDASKSIYKVNCKCSDYNVDTGVFIGEIRNAPIEKCDRAYGFTVESFNIVLRPGMATIQGWYSDLVGKINAAQKLIDNGRLRKLKKMIKKSN